MADFNDITNQHFGRLTATYPTTRRYKGQVIWRCRCDCGREVEIKGSSLRSGATRSCGCLHDEVSAARCRTHGQHKSPEYIVWTNMIQRCTNPNNPRFPQYGGRGIAICGRWRYAFATFLADMGPRPSAEHSIDRRDNNEGYTAENCYWGTEYAQRRNRSDTHPMAFNGETLCIADWAKRYGLTPQVVTSRLRLNWTLAEALLTPLHTQKGSHRYAVRTGRFHTIKSEL